MELNGIYYKNKTDCKRILKREKAAAMRNLKRIKRWYKKTDSPEEKERLEGATVEQLENLAYSSFNLKYLNDPEHRKPYPKEV